MHMASELEVTTRSSEMGSHKELYTPLTFLTFIYLQFLSHHTVTFPNTNM